MATNFASEAATLQAYVVAMVPDFTLRQYTNWNEDDQSSVNDTRLNNTCLEAIYWFEADFTDYDPGSFPLHQIIAFHRVMEVLYSLGENDVKMSEHHASIEGFRANVVVKKSLNPTSNSNVVTDHTFSDSHFDGLLPD